MKTRKKGRRGGRSPVLVFLGNSFFVMAGVFGLTLLYTNLNLSLIRQRYVLAELEEKRKKAENRKKELRIRINRLSSLENIEGTAVSKLGLREPDKSKIVWIKK